MDAASVIVIVLSVLCFAGSVGSGFMLFLLGMQGAPSSVTRYWLFLMIGLGLVGGLLGWVA